MSCLFYLNYDDSVKMWNSTLVSMDHEYMIGGSGYTPQEAIYHVMESFMLSPGVSLRNDKCNERLQDIAEKECS